MPDRLAAIVASKQIEVDGLRRRIENPPPEDGEANRLAEWLTRPRPAGPGCLVDALRDEPGLGVIAEIKRRSPSRGLLADLPDPRVLARRYVEGGATALSVLTDGPHFGGSLTDLREVAGAVSPPILRKDFILDEVQIAEAALHGAAAVLLIVAVLGRRVERFLSLTARNGLDALVEVHTEAELELALAAGADLVGVNNRDLTTFEVRLDTAERLAANMPGTVVAVAESGIFTPADAIRMAQAGYRAVLVGEALVRSADPAGLIRQFRDVRP